MSDAKFQDHRTLSSVVENFQDFYQHGNLPGPFLYFPLRLHIKALVGRADV